MSHAVWCCRCTVLLVSSHTKVNLDPGGREVCFAEINGDGQVQTLLADSSLTTVCNLHLAVYQRASGALACLVP